ncbi:MAG: YegS/Rv2252/BmrU family lipid kinase, partial [bacterium]
CFVVGGDGSVRDAALGLAGSETALAAIPAGTVNVWTKEAGIPPGILPAIDAHIEGQSVHMDLGRAGNSCFLLMAGIGWDAEIASRVPTRLKRLTGDIAYILQAALMAPVLRSKVTRWSTAEGPTEEQLAWMVLSNTRLYGGKVRLASTATIDDGALDVLAFCPERLSDTVRLVAKIAAGKREDPRLLQFQAPELTIESPGIPVQLDGDHIGETPMKFSIDPAALLVSVPAGPLSEVFSRPHINHREP